MAKGRRYNRTGRSEGMGRFVAVPFDLMDAPAYSALSTTARAIMLLVIRNHNGHNNGRIRLSARDGERWGLDKNTTARGLKELTAAGFLINTKEADYHSKKLAREYAITWQALDTGGPATRNYLAKNDSSQAGTDCPRSGTDVLLKVKRCA